MPNRKHKLPVKPKFHNPTCPVAERFVMKCIAERPSNNTAHIRDRLKAKLQAKHREIASDVKEAAHDTIIFPSRRSRNALWMRQEGSNNVYLLDPTDLNPKQVRKNFLPDSKVRCRFTEIDSPTPLPLLINRPISVNCAQAFFFHEGRSMLLDFYTAVGSHSTEAANATECFKAVAIDFCAWENNNLPYAAFFSLMTMLVLSLSTTFFAYYLGRKDGIKVGHNAAWREATDATMLGAQRMGEERKGSAPSSHQPQLRRG